MAARALPSPRIFDDDAPAAIPRAPKPALMRTLYAAVVAAQTRRAQREIDRVLGRRAPSLRMQPPPRP